MKDPIVIGVADIWGIEGWYANLVEDSTRTHDVVLFTSGIALTHTASRCEGPCPIHEPSSHHMRHLPAFYRASRNLIERCCDHGTWHPDPDQVTRWQQTLSPTEAVAQTVHGCCYYKCCEAPTTKGEHQ